MNGDLDVLVYPSLRADFASQLMAAHIGRSLESIRESSQLGHPSATWIGDGRRVTEEELAQLRDQLRELADNSGFPEPMQRNSAAIDFDRKLGTLLNELIDVPPFYASQPGMWMFLSCVVVPELAYFRYNNDPHESRYNGSDRDLLRSRWWRAFCLGPDLNDVSSAPPGCSPLTEDEFTSIMERPAIGYTPRLATAVRDCIWRHESHVGNRRMTFTRGLTRRIVSERTFRTLDLLDDKDLNEVLDGMAREVRRSLSEADK